MCDEIFGLHQQLTAQEAQRPIQQDTIEVPSISSSGPFTAKLKLEKPHTFKGNRGNLTNWIFLVTQYLDIVDVNNENLQTKYAVALFEGKVITWWRGMAGEHDLDTLSWRDLCTCLEDEFQDIYDKLKLHQQI